MRPALCAPPASSRRKPRPEIRLVATARRGRLWPFASAPRIRAESILAVAQRRSDTASTKRISGRDSMWYPTCACVQFGNRKENA